MIKEKKKILVYSTQMLQTGGIESHILEFLQKMAVTGLYELNLVVLNASLSINQKRQIKALCKRVYLAKGKGLLTRIKFLFITITASLFRTYDVLYTNGQGNSIRLIDKVFKHRNWVHHHHTAGDLTDQETWSKNYTQALKNADVVVACSKKNADEMKKALKREIIAIPCFSRKIDIRKTTDSRASGKIHLGYYGRLISEKGIDLLCKLSDDPDMAEIKFHIWGSGQKYNADFFNDYANLFYHGHFDSEEELKQVLTTIDAYLLLSTHPEGLPISLLELMGAGIPWMATNQGGISDIAHDQTVTRILDSLEPYELVKQKIKEFANDILLGKVDSAQQKRLYDEKFASPVLVKSWHNTLFSKQIS